MEKDSRDSLPGASLSPLAERVFGTRKRPDAMAGQTMCPACRREVPFRLRDVGEKINCPHCGQKGIRIGRSLLEERHVDHRLPGNPQFAVLVFPNRDWRRLSGMLVTVLLVSAALASSMAFTPSREVLLNSGWSLLEAVAVVKSPPATATAKVDASAVALTPPEITVESIEQLRQEPDLQKALVQAQVWQRMLRDYGVPEQDPRLLLLASLIAEFTEQLRPGPGPPPAYLTEFRQALKELRAALVTEDLTAAKDALDRARALYGAHSAELLVFSRSLSGLEGRYKQLWLRQEGRTRIADLLRAAETLLHQEKPLEAAEAISQALFLALRTPMEKQEFEDRKRTVQQLDKELRFARGKRAVADAERCHAQNDLNARDTQLAVAFNLLPDLPSERVTELLKRATTLAKEPIASPTDSGLGRAMRFRSVYEEALDRYGQRGTLVELAGLCVSAQILLQQLPELSDQADKVASLILEALDSEVSELASLPLGSPDVAPNLAIVREALEIASPWRETVMWSKVRATLDSKGNDVAARVIRDASQLSLTDLASAVRIIEPALTVGGPDKRQEARRLYDTWQAELAQRADLAAQEEAWAEMAARHKEGRSLDVWRLLDDFARRFPHSARSQELDRVRQAIRSTVDREVLTVMSLIDEHQRTQQWLAFREQVVRLQFAPLGSEQRAKLEQYQQTLTQMNEEAEIRYQKTQREPYRHMVNDEQIHQYFAALRDVLTLNPDHEQGNAKWNVVKGKARSMSAVLLLQARETGPKYESKYRDFLDRVVQLDPEGPAAADARKLLAALQPKTSPP